MRAFLHRWRWWLRGGAACVLALSVPSALYFFADGPDGSEEALERVHLGMSREQAYAVLAHTPYESKWGNSHYFHLLQLSESGPAGHLSPQDRFFGLHRVTTYSFRDHDIELEFHESGSLVAKHRVEKKGRPQWWHRALAYWNRARAALGV
jgi:hypothetical protein